MIKLTGILKPILCLLIIIPFFGCSAKVKPFRSTKAQIGYETQVSKDLRSLPPPKEKIVVSVYKFRDQTGQYKPGGSVVTYSTAVTQGATSMLIKALSDAGRGEWFTVLERESLSNLLNERKIIRQTRKQYLSKKNQRKSPALPPLLFAPIMLDGGIIAYESNLLTGGLGARYLGIGGFTEFARDTVTIYLRAVSVKNGRVLKSVDTSKTIFSVQLDTGVFKFVSFKDLLEVETGFATNEPPQMAVLEAIEKGVYSMIMEGLMDGLWSLQDPSLNKSYISSYLRDKRAEVMAVFDDRGNLTGFKPVPKKKWFRRTKSQ